MRSPSIATSITTTTRYVLYPPTSPTCLVSLGPCPVAFISCSPHCAFLLPAQHHQLTLYDATGEPETRRSARATKGQHKALEQLDQPVEPPKKRGKKGKKAALEPEQGAVEIIRCVCGASDQDSDAGDAWIACDECSVWQHNICVGLSPFTEDVPEKYSCEQCRPENHKELLDGIARGEKPWEARRRAHDDEEAEAEAEVEMEVAKKKKKGTTKKGKGKRASDSEPKQSPVPDNRKAKPSPAPVSDSKKAKPSLAPASDSKKAKPSPAPDSSKKESKAAATAGKRKVRDESQDKEPKVGLDEHRVRSKSTEANRFCQAITEGSQGI